MSPEKRRRILGRIGVAAVLVASAALAAGGIPDDLGGGRGDGWGGDPGPLDPGMGEGKYVPPEAVQGVRGMSRLREIESNDRLPAGGYDLEKTRALPPADANAPYTADLVLPPSAAGTSVVVAGLPWGLSYLRNPNPATRNIRDVLRLSGILPPDARTASFDVIVGSRSYRVTQPVKPGIHSRKQVSSGDLEFTTAPGRRVQEEVLASGEPGAVNWAHRGISPPGLSWSFSSSGTATLQGTPAPGAVSVEGWVNFRQPGGGKAERRVVYQVPIRTDSAVLAAEHRVQKRRSFSYVLPLATGGDGRTYRWSAGSYCDVVGLGVVERRDASGAMRWFAEGTVPEGAPLGIVTVRLWVSSPLSRSLGVDMVFRLLPTEIRPFRFWTQNTLLRSNNAPPNFHALAGLSLLGIPPQFVAAAIEFAWDQLIQNTGEDNDDRTNLILREMDRGTGLAQRPAFDIVALQEVWDPENYSQIRQHVANRYQFLDGPPPAGFEWSGGLVVLVENGLPVEDHRARPFGVDAGFDAYAQKGYTLTRIRMGADPDDYLWLVTTHTNADDSRPGEHAGVRQSQIALIRHSIDVLGDDRHPILLAGDWNVIGETPEHVAMLAGLGGPRDVYRELFPDRVANPGYTVDTTRNGYAYHWFDGDTRVQLERLDHMLVRQGRDYELRFDSIRVADGPIHTRMYHDEGWARQGFRSYLSDHYGLQAGLTLVKN